MEDSLNQLTAELDSLEDAQLDLRKHLDDVVYEATQLNVWLFLATIACVSLPPGNYRTLSFVLVAAAFIYQLDMFIKLRLNSKIYKRKLNKLSIRLEAASQVIAEIKKSNKIKTQIKKVDDSEFNLNWKFWLPFVLNFLFFLFSYAYFGYQSH